MKKQRIRNTGFRPEANLYGVLATWISSDAEPCSVGIGSLAGKRAGNAATMLELARDAPRSRAQIAKESTCPFFSLAV